MGRRLARMPTRLRLTLAFALASAVVLAGLGVYLHAALADKLDETIRESLQQRTRDLAAIARRGDPGLRHEPAFEREDDVAQVLDRSGRVIDGTPGFASAPLLRPAELARAAAEPVDLPRRPMPGEQEIDVMLVAAPAGERVVVAGASLDDRDDALAELDRLLLAGLPAALLLASMAGFLVAGRALAPVERMRRRADDIRTDHLTQRLPVPAADDEVRRLAETLNAMLDRLEQGFERERAFASDASHELRTPLARLRAELELALRPGRDAGELRAALASAQDEANRLSRLAEDLLVVARADRGALPVRREALDVREVLETVQRRFAGAGDVGVPADGAGPVPLVADRLRLEQALGNLVDNALRHGAGPVTLGAARTGGTVELHVTDEGPGFPDGFEERAFERFTRGDEARSGGGAGLGLAIVAAIAQAHGGSASVTSATQGGAVARIVLPASGQEQGTEPESST